MKFFRIIFGALIWLGLAGGLGGWLWHTSSTPTGQRWTTDVWRFATGQRRAQPIDVRPGLNVRVGDPIFVIADDGQFQRVGQVTLSLDGKGQALFFASGPNIPAGSTLTFHETPHSMQWVLQTMLPPEKRQQMTAELTAAFEQHHEEILTALRPVVEATLTDALVVVQEDLPAALARREPQLRKLNSRYQREIVQQRLLPAVQRELWPIVQRHAEPVAEQMGREMYQRASLWRFGWRFAYDASPLPNQGLVEKEFKRFLANDAAPVVQAHGPEMMRVQQAILEEAAANPAIRSAIEDSLREVVDDPAARRLIWEVVREVLVENPRMKEVVDKHWRGEQAKEAFQLAASRFEPAVRRIGEMLLGTPHGGITPEFARVLRNQILGKDRRWLVVRPPLPGGSYPDNTITIVAGEPDAPNPFLAEARREAS